MPSLPLRRQEDRALSLNKRGLPEGEEALLPCLPMDGFAVGRW